MEARRKTSEMKELDKELLSWRRGMRRGEAQIY